MRVAGRLGATSTLWAVLRPLRVVSRATLVVVGGGGVDAAEGWLQVGVSDVAVSVEVDGVEEHLVHGALAVVIEPQVKTHSSSNEPNYAGLMTEARRAQTDHSVATMNA